MFATPNSIGNLNDTLGNNECLDYTRASNVAKYSFDLRRMVRRTGLVDLGFQGTKFTWFKKSSGTNTGSSLNREMLDRVLGTVDWRIAWPNAIVHHLHAAVSDHNPILLDTTGGRQCIKTLFKYDLMWERDPRVFCVVKKAWMERGHNDPMVNLHIKIKNTKEHLSRRNKTQFKRLTCQLKAARSKLAELESCPIFNEEAHTIARVSLNEALAREEIFWRQKSRVAWLKDGD